jgi:hypothetical protein
MMNAWELMLAVLLSIAVGAGLVFFVQWYTDKSSPR